MTYKTKFFRGIKLLDIEKQMNDFMETTEIREISQVLSLVNSSDYILIILVYWDGKPSRINKQSIENQIKKATEKRDIKLENIEEHLKHLKG